MSVMDYDAELRLHTEVLRRAYGIGPHDHVLDIGCGAGETTHVLRRPDDASAERALERLSETVAAHASGDGVWFDSRAWLVIARRR
jgi:predicted TPR repeat methyltransferase